MSPIYTPGKVVLAQTYVEGDRYFNETSLLLHGNGTNGSTTIVDNSPTPKTLFAVGTTQISTAQSKPGFGGSSIYLGSAGSLNVTNQTTDFSFGTGDFTAEAWIYFVSITGETRIFAFAGGEANTTLNVGYNFGNNNKFTIVNESVAHIATSSVGFTPNTWQHFAFTRSSGTCRLFLDGTQIATVNSSVGNNNPGTFVIGYGTFLAYYDEVRITKGVARYTANFTPPTDPFADGYY